MKNSTSSFKAGQKVSCFRAGNFEILPDRFRSLSLVVSFPVGRIVREVTKEEDVACEDLGGIFEVEMISSPKFEVLTNSKSQEEVSEFLKKLPNAELSDLVAQNPAIFGELHYQPLSPSTSLSKANVFLSGNNLKKIVQN